MDQLVELLKQIQDLAGVAIDALDGAKKGPHEPDRDETRSGAEPPGPEEKQPPA